MMRHSSCAQGSGSAAATVAALLLSSLPALMLAGCTRAVYEIELTPQGESMHRKITFWREANGDDGPQTAAPSDEELVAIAEAYRAEVPAAAAKKYEFSTDFSAAAPQDVGGSGWYFPLACPLGETGAYVERFRGSDDLSADLDQRFRALDRLGELLDQFVQAETRDAPGAAKLREFVAGDLRRDARNLCLYLWACGIVGQYEERFEEEMAVRVTQYLVERRYFRPEEIPQLMQAFDRASSDDVGPMLQLVQRMLARKMGIDDSVPVPQFLVEMLQAEHLAAAWNDLAAKTAEYRKLLVEWEKNRESDPTAEKPEPTQILDDLLVDAFLPGFVLFASTDQLTVKLRLSHQPFLTNGEWEAESALVTWSKKLPSRDHDRPEWPCVLYALWAEPREAYQMQHFGKVVADGEDLASFCAWYRALSAEQAACWDRFVEQLEPGAELAEKIKRFTFPGEPPVDNLQAPPPSLADTAKATLILALVGEQWPPPPAEPEGRSGNAPAGDSPTAPSAPPPAPAPAQGKPR